MSDLNEKGIEAAWEAIAPFASGRNKDAIVHAAIPAYLSAAVPANVAGLAERLLSAGDHYGIPIERDTAEAAAALAAMAAEVEMLRKDLDEARAVHRWSVDDTGDGVLHVCRDNHAKGEPCTWERFVSAERAESADAEIARLRAALAEKDKALEPFSDAAGEYFARNYNNSDVIATLLERKDDKLSRAVQITFSHLVAARRAHGGQADG